LRRIASGVFRRAFALGQLSEYEKFILFGGDELIWALRPSGAVLVLGGFRGESTVRYASTASKVVSLEPVEEFRNQMVLRTADLRNVICLDFAASNEDGSLSLNLDGDGTSAIRTKGPGKVLDVRSRDIAAVVDEYGPFELLECNIEGGEYSVIPRLTDSSAISNVEKVIVQFHDIGPETETARGKVQQGLSRTHLRVWSYDLVWELWVRF
jgi:FkbM family methyltransferase